MKYIFFCCLFFSFSFSHERESYCSSEQDLEKLLFYYSQSFNTNNYLKENKMEQTFENVFKENYFGLLYVDCLGYIISKN